MKHRRSISGTSCARILALALFADAGPTFAQDGSIANQESSHEAETGLGEIVVTAQRREQNLQNVPIAVNAFSSDMVETRRISDIQSLSTSVPGFSINSLSKSRL